MSSSNPILNNPYQAPIFHYATSVDGELNYDDVRPGRRIFVPEVQPIPVKQGPQKSLYEVNDFSAAYETHLVNLLRKEVGQWRKTEYEGTTTRVTRELLQFWFAEDPDSDIPRKKLFFAQQEAIETAIWLNEVASRSNAGTAVLQKLSESRLEQVNGLPRVALKMATGTGKTVVMAALILYHYFNRQEYRNDPRFADGFLLVAPGITIRDRLGVLRVDTSTTDRHRATDYYRQRNLVPAQFDALLEGLNARLVITNYHAFEPKVLQGNKKSPFDGKVSRKVNEAGEVVVEKNDANRENKEDFGQVVKRLMGRLKPGSRLLVINDEAHHCYLPPRERPQHRGERHGGRK